MCAIGMTPHLTDSTGSTGSRGQEGTIGAAGANAGAGAGAGVCSGVCSGMRAVESGVDGVIATGHGCEGEVPDGTRRVDVQVDAR
jgi:hypothetical protein